MLRLESLPEAWIAPPELRELRELVRHRQTLIKVATSVKSGIRRFARCIRVASLEPDGDFFAVHVETGDGRWTLYDEKDWESWQSRILSK